MLCRIAVLLAKVKEPRPEVPEVLELWNLGAGATAGPMRWKALVCFVLASLRDVDVGKIEVDLSVLLVKVLQIEISTAEKEARSDSSRMTSAEVVGRTKVRIARTEIYANFPWF